MNRGVVALAALAALGLGACGEDQAPAADVNPSPSEGVAGPFILPPLSSPGSLADTGPAAQALTAAAKQTSESGSFRVKLTASFAGAVGAPRGGMQGMGEAESHTRFHLNLVFASGTQQLTTESVSYDGTNWGRSNTQPWHVVASAGSSGDPRSYLGYLTGATAVRDAGPGLQDGRAAERYEATVPIKRQAAGATPAATVAPATLGQLVAWVDAASGRLVAEEVTTSVGTPAETRLTIAFSDFGGDIKVIRPVLTP